MIRNYANPYAIVIGLDSIQGLQTARILARRNVPVIGITGNRKYHTSSTRVCKQIMEVNTSTEELIELLEKLGPELQQKAVLFPSQDKNVLVVSLYRQRLEPWYHIMLPDHDVVDMLMDKVSFSAYAEKNGFAIPRSCNLTSREEAVQAAQTLNFPVNVKPTYRSSAWTRHTQAKGYKVTSPEELLEVYDQHHAYTSLLMAQEWIEGPPSNLYSCNCYYDSNHQALVTFVSHKVRQWPPLTGQSCLGEDKRNDHVVQETLRLFDSVKYTGLGYLEMKRDDRNGKYYLVEPNIGRPTGRSAIAEAGGVELHYTMYCDALGWPLPENREQKYTGVKWVHFLRDLLSAAYFYRKGELTLKDWLRSLRGIKTDALFSWRDPMPFLKAVGESVPVFLSRGKRDFTE